MINFDLRIYLKVLLVSTMVLQAASAENQSESAEFVSCKGDKLYLGEEEFRFVSFNIPNLHLIEDNFSFEEHSPWRWPNEFEIRDALETVRQMGGTVVRIYVLSVRREGSDMGEHVYVRGPGDFNEEAFQVLDKVLDIARQKKIRVIIPFVDNWHWWGGRSEYASFRGKQADDFWTDEQLITDFQKTIQFTLNRKNTCNGVVYKEDPTIFGWETGNELDSPPDWTRRIAAYIKQIDSKHLVIDGYSLHGVRQESLDDPHVDVITTHHYPNTDADYIAAILKAHKQTKGKKPYFVGEFGFVPLPEIEKVLDTVIEQGISGALLWSIRFHNRDGGFYWHSEPSGDNLFKAYHWPGFLSGESYDERPLLHLVRKKAFEIRGMAEPPQEPPHSPVLLPIEDVAAISWRGSAGADSYEVLRSLAPEGTWHTVGSEISDADVQYRPLFADDSAALGQGYYYKVIATNGAGVSEPSNIVGPVKSSFMTLVDEFHDLSRTTSHSGQVKLVSRDARKTHEDIHRVLLEPGSSITYRSQGPIEFFRGYAFTQLLEPNARVEYSSDAVTYHPSELRVHPVEASGGDYGYLKPILLTGNLSGKGATSLRISIPVGQQDDASLQLSRIEISSAGSRRNSETEKLGRKGRLWPSILLFHKPYQNEGVSGVRRAAKLGSKKVNIVVTLHCQIDEERNVKRFGIVRDGLFQSLDEFHLKSFRDTLRRTFVEAVEQQMDVAILAHLNSWGEIGDWRNYFRFDPLKSYEGYTYQEAVIGSILESLMEAEVSPDRVELSLAGEMGRSVFLHADSYLQMMDSIRNDPHTNEIQLGVSLNFNRVSGEAHPTRGQSEAVQSLLNRSDFLGFSNYRWFSLPPHASDFSNAVSSFIRQLERLSISVPAEMPLHFSEVGVGGGKPGNQLAESPVEAARTPWEGSDDISKDPWKSENMRRFRIDCHRALLNFLRTQSGSHRVDHAYIWSEGSWDPMDIQERGFGDEQIVSMIQEHNSAVARDSGVE